MGSPVGTHLRLNKPSQIVEEYTSGVLLFARPVFTFFRKYFLLAIGQKKLYKGKNLPYPMGTIKHLNEERRLLSMTTFVVLPGTNDTLAVTAISYGSASWMDE
jgi:hypothetical protein